jgi:hypothetical protein
MENGIGFLLQSSVEYVKHAFHYMTVFYFITRFSHYRNFKQAPDVLYATLM